VLLKVERQLLLRLLKVWADNAYQGELEDWLRNEWGIELELVRRDPQQTG
jgi:hypothetical protein